MDLHRSTTARMVGVGVIAILIAGGCDGSTGPEPGARDEIVYHVRTVAAEADLFAMRADGAQPRQVTTAPGDHLFPAVSLDGERVAFRSIRDGNSEIYVINADGTGEVRLTNDPAFDVTPAWAPDGQRLVFSSDRDEGKAELYTVRRDGTGLTRLTNNTVADFDPHWSPDGTKIVTVRETEPSRYDLYVLNSDGTNPVRVTDARFQEFSPRWSPDGRRIAFMADTIIALQSGGVGQMAIAIVDAGGSPRELLTPFSGAAIGGLTWSRDGTRIIFARSGDLWSLDVRDKSVSQLTNTPTLDEAAPSWRRVP